MDEQTSHASLVRNHAGSPMERCAGPATQPMCARQPRRRRTSRVPRRRSTHKRHSSKGRCWIGRTCLHQLARQRRGLNAHVVAVVSGVVHFHPERAWGRADYPASKSPTPQRQRATPARGDTGTHDVRRMHTYNKHRVGYKDQRVLNQHGRQSTGHNGTRGRAGLARPVHRPRLGLDLPCSFGLVAVGTR